MWNGRTRRKLWTVTLPTWLLIAGTIQAAELSVGNLLVVPGTTSDVVVSGTIGGESTYGVRIQLEIVPRPGAIGTVGFTRDRVG